MKKTTIQLLRACAISTAIIGVMCSKADNPAGSDNNNNGNPPLPNPHNVAQVMSASYTLVGTDSLHLSVPSRPYCDTLGVLSQSALTTQSVKYILSGDQLKISLAATSVLGAITQIPGFDPQMGATLATIGGSAAAFPMYAVLERADTGSGLDGAWALNDLDIGFLALIDSINTIKNNAMNAITTEDGSGVIYLDFDNGQMSGNVERSFLAGAVAHSLADTSIYNVEIDSLTDSSWAIHGNVTHAEVAVAADRSGNVLFSDGMGQAHTYYAEPAQCPNDLVPTWFGAFLEANRR